MKRRQPIRSEYDKFPPRRTLRFHGGLLHRMNRTQWRLIAATVGTLAGAALLVAMAIPGIQTSAGSDVANPQEAPPSSSFLDTGKRSGEKQDERASSPQTPVDEPGDEQAEEQRDAVDSGGSKGPSADRPGSPDSKAPPLAKKGGNDAAQPAPVPVRKSTAQGAVAPVQNGLRQYPLHTNIVATTFWVGEIFDANAADGSQMLSTYDANWFAHYGGCDGIGSTGVCETEQRTAANGFFPTAMTPKENPFYLDLPFDDVNDSTAFKARGSVIPWAGDAAYAGDIGNNNVSLMKNRWVRILANGQTCYGQIQDAGPGQYHDANYVFGATDARPANTKYSGDPSQGAGMDVSPALNGCLKFADLNGQDDKVSWQFVEAGNVPAGPWKTVVTTSGVTF